jgi:iron complex outermembrane recepter protein
MNTTEKHLRRLAITPVALAVTLALDMGVAQAQTATQPQATQEIESIVVTARRVKERLQEVPVSVSAFGAEQIQANGLQGMEDVARLTPGFSFERTTSALAQPAIRGQAQYRVTNPVQNVATYFNGIYLQRSYQVDSDLLGLERVEVIKGPQSALFGRNAFAGAISYVTQKPSLDKMTLRGEVTLGNYERRDVKALASIPFANKAAISLAVTSSKIDGTWPNNNPSSVGLTGPEIHTSGNLNGYDNKGALLQLRVQPTDSTELAFFWSNRSLKVESPANYQMAARGLVTAFNNMNCQPFETPLQASNGVNALYCGALTATPQLAAGETRSPGLVADRRAYSQDSTSNVYGFSVDHAISDKWSVSATYGKTSADNINNATLSRDPERGVGFSPFLPAALGKVLLDSRGNGTIESDSVEARLTYETKKLRTMVGVYHANVSDFDYGSTYAAAANSGAALSSTFFPAGDLFPPGFSASQRNEAVYGLFGSVSAEVMPGLRLTAEGRETRESITQQAVTFPAQVPTGTVFSRTFNYFTPRVIADYKLTPNAMLYASAAQGVKSGGFNTAAALESDRVYEPEKNWTYELGLKSSSNDGSILFNAAAYVVDWTGLQVNRPATGAAVGTPTIVGNVSGADVKGLEATLRWRPIRALTFDAAASYTKAVFKDGAQDPQIVRALCSPATVATTCPFRSLADIGGKTVPRAPGTMATLGATWRSGIGAWAGQGMTLTARADASYQSKMYVDPTNLAWAPERTLINASVGLEAANWSLRVWGRNLADREYVSYAFVSFGAGGPATGATYAPLLGDRRTIGATLALQY